MNAVVEQRMGTLVETSRATDQSRLIEIIAQVAQDPRADLDRMERLMAMHERMSAKQAEQDFIAAMAEFKLNPPKIIKDKMVGFSTRASGDQPAGRTEYKHATLGAVCAAAIEGLAKVGISHRWDLEQPDGRVRVTCVLTHRGGHSVKTALEAGKDDSGKKNLIQQMASAVTYLQRYTLLAATGLATEDDDGRGFGGGGEEGDTISEKQVADLEALITEVRANKASLLRFAMCDRLDQIKAANYKSLVELVESKRGK